MAVETTTKKILNLLSEGMPKPAAGQTLIVKSVTAHTSYQTLHTVATGKTFYLMGFLGSSEIVTVNRWVLSIDEGSTQIFLIRAMPRTTGNQSNYVLSTGWPIAQVAAGEVIQAKAFAISTADSFTIWGWEE